MFFFGYKGKTQKKFIDTSRTRNAMGVSSEKRRDEVLAAITRDSGSKVSELARQFDVSMETIRNDIKYWEEAGLLKKTHGGAVLKSNVVSLRHINERIVENIDIKNDIAAKAAGYIPENGTIFLDAGTTTVCVAKYLNLMSGLTILTNSVLAASKLAQSNNRVMVIGGVLRGDILGTSGPWATMVLRTMLIDVAFLDSSGFGGGDGPFSTDLNDVEFKRAVIDRAKTKIVLADSGKLLTSGIMSYCAWEDIDALITNPAGEKKAFDRIAKHTNVIYV
jgi:DeoR family fructose operon transcriptional repressor